ncbi:hypothetical protein ABPG72_007409 [Tetrahymena utriculariae]
MDYSLDPYHMKFQSSIYPNVPELSIDIAAANGNYIYVGVADSPFVAYNYDISDQTDPKLVDKFPFDGPTDADGLYISIDKKYLAQYNFSCIILYDISNPAFLNMIFQWFPPSTIVGSIKDLCMSQDNNYIIGSVRNWEYVVLDIYDKSNLKLKNVLQTSGGEGMIVSLNQKYIYCFDGFRGLLILDILHLFTAQKHIQYIITNKITIYNKILFNQVQLKLFRKCFLQVRNIQKLPDLKIVSKLQLTGWLNYIQRMYNDQYLLVDDYENDQLSLVDIRDITNPILMSTYNSKREQPYAVCNTKNSKYGFIITDKGVRTIPFKSDITIHTYISQVVPQSGGEPLLISLPPNQNLLLSFYLLQEMINLKYFLKIQKVGQTIQFKFIIIRPIIQIAIINIYYQDNYEMKSLPYWMDYTSSSQSLNIKVVKDGLGTNFAQPNLNTVIIQTAIPIINSSFIYNDKLAGLTTTPQQANFVYEYLISQYLLDSNNFVTSFFDHNQTFSFNILDLQVSNMKRLFQLVKLT